jgi:hypothetical protein
MIFEVLARALHQTLVERKRANGCGHIAAIAGVVHQRFGHADLRKGVVDIGIHTTGGSYDAYFRQGRHPASHAIELAPIRVRCSHDLQENRVPLSWIRRQVLASEHDRLGRPSTHEGRAYTPVAQLRFAIHVRNCVTGTHA